MKTIVALLSLLSSVQAFAAPSKYALIARNSEVKSVISTFEKNRSHKCSPISRENILISSAGLATVLVTCNAYDQNGLPQADVYEITISGSLSGSEFAMSSVKIEGIE